MDESSDNQPQPTPVNQTPQGAQTPPATNVNQHPVQPIQPAQSGVQQQPVSETTAVITSQTNGSVQPGDSRESKLKYPAYFLLGLILSVLGLIIGVIWIIAKEEQAKMGKVIALLLGVAASVLVLFVITGGITFGGPTLEAMPTGTSQAAKQVETEITRDLSSIYPNRSFRVVYGEHSPPLRFGETTISTFVTVKLSAEEQIEPLEIVAVGNQVCATLTKLQLSVSQVQIETVNTKGISSSSLGIGGTCDEYSSGVILNTLQSM